MEEKVIMKGTESVMPHLLYSEISGNPNGFVKGINLRQHYAGLAMQGLMTTLIPTAGNKLCPNYENVKYMANLAVTAADELLEALNK